MRQVLTQTHQSKGAGTGRLMMQTLVNDRKRERGREKEGALLKLIASSLCWEGTVHFCRWVFLPDFLPGLNKCIDYRLVMRADCICVRHWMLLPICWAGSFLKLWLTFSVTHLMFLHLILMKIIEGHLLTSPISFPLFCYCWQSLSSVVLHFWSLSNRRVGSPCRVGLHMKHLHWDVSTVRLLLSGEETHLTPSLHSSFPSHTPPVSPSPYYPSFLRLETGDVWWQRCQHRSWWSPPAVVPTGQGSRYIPPCSRSPSIYSLCSPGPHSCPSRASTVQPHRALVTQIYGTGERSLWMFPSSFISLPLPHRPPTPNHPDSTLCLFSSVFLSRHNYSKLCLYKRLKLARQKLSFWSYINKGFTSLQQHFIFSCYFTPNCFFKPFKEMNAENNVFSLTEHHLNKRNRLIFESATRLLYKSPQKTSIHWWQSILFRVAAALLSLSQHAVEETC